MSERYMWQDMRKYIFIILAMTCLFEVFSQNTLESELVKKIKSFKTDKQLNDFLVENKMIPESEDSSYFFHVGRIQTDIFKKNIFNDLEEEVILQLRENKRYAVNVFYYKNKNLIKIPGYILEKSYSDPGYGEQIFTFHFENIFMLNDYSIVCRHYTEFNRTTYEKYSVWDICKDSLMIVYEFELNSSTYSGILTYDYSTIGNYGFVTLNNEYPKVLNINKKIKNINNAQRNDESELVSGIITEINTQKTVYFGKDNKGWKVVRIDENLNSKVIYIDNEQ
ncbi:MAG: hypothetical protein U0U66_02860 [Cytophagaceae bacterium]